MCEALDCFAPLAITISEGGVRGEIVAEGVPEEVAKEPRSFTDQHHAPMLERVAEGVKWINSTSTESVFI